MGLEDNIIVARSAIESCWTYFIFHFLPFFTIYSLTETAPLIERFRLRQLGFLSHVLLLPENKPFWEFEMYDNTHRRRKPRIQQTLFTNYIYCLLGDPDILLNDKLSRWVWLKTAIDRGTLLLTVLKPKDDNSPNLQQSDLLQDRFDLWEVVNAPHRYKIRFEAILQNMLQFFVLP